MTLYLCFSSHHHIRSFTTFHHNFHIYQVYIWDLTFYVLTHFFLLSREFHYALHGRKKIWWKVVDARICCCDFHVRYDGPFLIWKKTTALFKSPYYTWQMCNIWWKVYPKNALVKNFTSTDFLRPICLYSSTWGTSTPNGSKIPLKHTST